MIGFGLGGGLGSVDQAITHVGITGGDAYMGWLGRFSQGWQRLQSDMNKPTAAERFPMASQGMGGNSRIGIGLSNGLSGSAATFFGAAMKKGMEAVESESLVKTTFGKMTGDINKWSQGLSKSLGFNQYDTRRQAAQFQTQFTAGGMDATGAEKMAKSFTEMKGDLVSFYNSNEQETFAAIQSGINGESEPLRRFSIYLSDAATKQYAYSHGIAAANSELSEQQKLKSRAGFILQSFRDGKAYGDAERTKDSPANRLRAQQSQLTEQLTATGMSLMPLVGDALTLTNQLIPPVQKAVKWFSALDETTRRWVLGLAVAGPQVTRLFGLFKGAKDVLGVGKSVLPGIGAGTVATMTVKAAVVNVNGGGGSLANRPGGALGTSYDPTNPAARGPWWKNLLTGKALAPEAGATGTMARLFPAGLSAFGMGTMATTGIIAAGGVAAYKLPGYMRDATGKSDDAMNASSDPMQWIHAFAGRGLSETSWHKRLMGVTALDEMAEKITDKRSKELFAKLDAPYKAQRDGLKYLNDATAAAMPGADAARAHTAALIANQGKGDVVENVWDKRTKAVSELFFGPDNEANGTRKVQGNAQRNRSGGVQVSYEIPAGAGDIGARDLNFLVNTPARATM